MMGKIWVVFKGGTRVIDRFDWQGLTIYHGAFCICACADSQIFNCMYEIQTILRSYVEEFYLRGLIEDLFPFSGPVTFLGEN
jgi:hypothetical protein